MINSINLGKLIKIQKIWRGYLVRHYNILTPVLPIELDINYDLLSSYVKDYITPRKEYYNDSVSNNLELESGFSEWWIKKASNGKKIGDGNCPMDVVTGSGKAIDTMCLCLNGSISNEKSIMQNFNKSGNYLDSYFLEKNENRAVSLYINDYIYKIKNFSLNNKISLNNLYYAIFISTNESIYLSCFKINIGFIKNIKADGFTKQCKSIKIKNFIDDKYGNVKLYKSKKRLELRISKNVLNNFNTIKLY
jgi:hypothetical protein